MAQGTANRLVTIGATSTEVVPAVSSSGMRRTQLIIVNSSAAANATIAKGEVSAVINQGILLLPNGSYVEATDGGYDCWQGAVQAIASAAGTLSIVESFI